MNKEKIINNLDMCKVEEYEDYLEVTLPVILSFNSQLITLRIYLRDDGYYVSSTDTLFDEYVEYSANYCESYYNDFISNDNHYHYDIKRHDAYLYKKYDYDYSARCAVDEFVKFFIYLDEYIFGKE